MVKKKRKEEKYIKIGDRFADKFLDSIVKALISTPRLELTWRQVTATFLLFSFTLGVSGLGSSPVVGYTFGFYQDEEKSEDNTFIAGEIDFILNASSFTPTTTAISLSPQDITTKEIIVDPQDSNPFKYVVSTENAAGDTDFCNALNVEAELEGLVVYDDDLVPMLTDATTTLDTWNFTIGMGQANFQNKICNFDTQYFGSQVRHDYDLGDGFNDTEIEENTIASWGFRINKVYYDVGPERGADGANEWVEIFNQTNVPLDIDGWEICDNTSCDVLSASEPIPAQGFGFIVASSTTASNVLPTYWYIPEAVVEITIGSALIGNGLGNNADMLILKRPDGVIMDQMNWGTPNTGWTNWNEDVWDPGSVDVAEGSALARVPNGYDTNQPSDFVELKPPTLDLIYPDEGGTYTWYWNNSYTIEWIATNNNGPDEDLNISLFYVKDISGDGELGDGDIMLTIADTTENNGLYEWTVPSGFLGYIWIYLVGTGPENPMLNTGTISGDIWDPEPIYIGPEDGDNGDYEAPVITINGNNPALVPLGGGYADLGAEVTDNVNSNLGVNTLISVDTETLGEYQVIYTATDQAGNTAEAVRTVIVYDPDTSSAEEALMNADISSVDETQIIADEPVVEELVIEEVVEEPVVEEPVVEAPVVEEPIVEEPIIEEPVMEEPVIEEVVEELVVEEPIVEEVVEEPIIEEPIIEEPEPTQEPVIEEAVIDEPIIEEPVIIEEVVEEPVIVPLELTDPQADPTSNGIQEPVIVEPIIEEPIIEELESVSEDTGDASEPSGDEAVVVEPVIEEPVDPEPTPEPVIVPLEADGLPEEDTTSNGVQEPVEEPVAPAPDETEVSTTIE